MTRRKKSTLAAGLVMGAFTQLAFTPLALAQTAAAPATGGTLGEVTITVNKREERLQDVPATATVVPARQLEQQNITTLQELARAVPTLDGSEATGFSIRGFGGLSYSLTAESSVGILIDGVSLSGAGAFPPNLFDVERVEVLEGPQGTLFGKNATAGIINIVTKAPNTAKFEGQVRVDAQNREGKSAQAALNLPVNDTLALRLTASVLDDPRTSHNLSDGAWDSPNRTNARLRLLWKATNDVVVNLSADQSETRLRGGGRWSIYQSTPGSLLTTSLNACGVKVGPGNTDVCLNPGQNGSKTTAGGFSAQVDWAIGDYLLTSVSAVRDARNYVPGGDYDSINLPAPAYTQTEDKKFHNISQEFRVASPDYDWGNFVTGLYYFKGDNSQDITAAFRLPAARLGTRNLIDGETTSAAVFGQGTYKLDRALSLNFGARLGREQVSATRTGTLSPGAVAPLVAANLIPVNGNATDTYLSWRTGAQYDFSPGRMGYVTYSHGYKGPAVNQNATNPKTPLVVRPEVPDMLEAGLKNLFLEGKLGVNVSAYAMKVKDFQAQVWDPGAGAFVFSNAPELTGRGVTLNVYGQPTRSLTVNGGAAYMLSKLGAGFLVPCATGTAPACTRDARGEQANGAPKLRATLAVDYAFPVASLHASVGGDVVYTSEKIFDRTDPARNLPATTLFGARFVLRSADEKVGLTFYARNLFDKFNPTYRTGNLAAFATADTRSYMQFTGMESRRVLGVSLDAKF
ncbi:MAG: TonB-dependent receptor [Comamonadaceae bacterium]|nr:MAG: TonB-dependent receptor [Comamonadaceae bacterium]